MDPFLGGTNNDQIVGGVWDFLKVGSAAQKSSQMLRKPIWQCWWVAGQSEEFSDVAENQVNCWRETAAMPKKGKSGSKKGRQRWLMGDR